MKRGRLSLAKKLIISNYLQLKESIVGRTQSCVNTEAVEK